MTEFCDGGSLDAMLGLEADNNAQARVFTMPEVSECILLCVGMRLIALDSVINWRWALHEASLIYTAVLSFIAT